MRAARAQPDAPTERLSAIESLATPTTGELPPAKLDATQDPVSVVGKVLLGRYEILGVLGRGGMGVVFEARDRTLDRVVVVKVLSPNLAGDTRAAQRLVREARVAARVNHPAIVSILDVGLLETGEPCLVMERLVGRDLADCIGRWGKLSVDATLVILEPIAAALEQLHAVGIVHRDVKPANIFVLNGLPMRVKLVDFGLALLDDAGYARLTQRGVIVGTPEYFAPEIARGAPATASADIYSLASVAYEMLSGKPPFEGEPLDILAAKTQRLPPRLDALGATSELVARVIERAMSMRPNDRPIRATHFVREFAAARDASAAIATTTAEMAHGGAEAPITLPVHPTLMRGAMVFLGFVVVAIAALAAWVH